MPPLAPPLDLPLAIGSFNILYSGTDKQTLLQTLYEPSLDASVVNMYNVYV